MQIDEKEFQGHKNKRHRTMRKRLLVILIMQKESSAERDVQFKPQTKKNKNHWGNVAKLHFTFDHDTKHLLNE